MGIFDHFETTRTIFEETMISGGQQEASLGDRHDTQPGELPSVVPENAPNSLKAASRYMVENTVVQPEDN